MFNLVYLIILLGVIGVVYALFLHGENIIVLIIVVLVPLIAAGQSLCQIIHFAHRKSTKGVSFLTTVLIWLGPFFSSVAIVCFLLADRRNWHPMLYMILYTDLPANIVSFLMVLFYFCYSSLRLSRSFSSRSTAISNWIKESRFDEVLQVDQN
jgi:hypothetical protein